MEYWNNIYDKFDPIAFNILTIPIHWYGIMYVFALITSLYIGKYFIKKDKINIKNLELDNYFIYAEIGVILGARLGYILFYSDNSIFYLTHPWEIFNPFHNGKFVGISGMSYHGAVIGFLLGSFIYSYRNKVNFGEIMDLVSISIPLGYVFGRIGNFLNQELIGRETTVEWGIYVNGVLRHPSQLYEAFLEGFVLFLIVFFFRKYKKFNGEIMLVYGIGYGILRTIAEIYRAPDIGKDYVLFNSITQGQLMSFSMAFLSFVLWIYFTLKIKTKLTLS
jgi:phosphatidylglycerol:prolipoprotein diacylglycerol transferase